MEARDLEEVTLNIRLPRYLRDNFKRAVKENLVETSNVNETLVSYMIKIIGNYNKQVRQASKEI